MRNIIASLMLMCIAQLQAQAQHNNPSGDHWLKGTVTYTDGLPVPNAVVVIQNAYLEGPKTTVTDENGRYSFKDLNAAVEPSIRIEISQDVAYEFDYINTSIEHDFILERADRYVSGQVVDHEGTPLSDFILTVLPRGKRPSGIARYSWQTDEHGMFEKYGFSEKSVDIEVQAPEWDGIYAKYKVFENIPTNEKLKLVIGEQDRLLWPLPTSDAQRARQHNEQRLKGRLTGLYDEKAPELVVDRWVYGDPVALADAMGNVVVLHFWSMNDTRSKNKTKFISLLDEAYSNQGLRCVSIHEYAVDSTGLDTFLAENAIHHSVVVDRQSEVKYSLGTSFDLFGISSVNPNYIVIDKNGLVEDFCRDDELEYTVKELLAE